jgi:hypothetical protein
MTKFKMQDSRDWQKQNFKHFDFYIIRYYVDLILYLGNN